MTLPGLGNFSASVLVIELGAVLCFSTSSHPARPRN